jgi:hypothetical protein
MPSLPAVLKHVIHTGLAREVRQQRMRNSLPSSRRESNMTVMNCMQLPKRRSSLRADFSIAYGQLKRNDGLSAVSTREYAMSAVYRDVEGARRDWASPHVATRSLELAPLRYHDFRKTAAKPLRDSYTVRAPQVLA